MQTNFEMAYSRKRDDQCGDDSTYHEKGTLFVANAICQALQTPQAPQTPLNAMRRLVCLGPHVGKPGESPCADVAPTTHKVNARRGGDADFCGALFVYNRGCRFFGELVPGQTLRLVPPQDVGVALPPGHEHDNEQCRLLISDSECALAMPAGSPSNLFVCRYSLAEYPPKEATILPITGGVWNTSASVLATSPSEDRDPAATELLMPGCNKWKHTLDTCICTHAWDQACFNEQAATTGISLAHLAGLLWVGKSAPFGYTRGMAKKAIMERVQMTKVGNSNKYQCVPVGGVITVEDVQVDPSKVRQIIKHQQYIDMLRLFYGNEIDALVKLWPAMWNADMLARGHWPIEILQSTKDTLETAMEKVQGEISRMQSACAESATPVHGAHASDETWWRKVREDCRRQLVCTLEKEREECTLQLDLLFMLIQDFTAAPFNKVFEWWLVAHQPKDAGYMFDWSGQSERVVADKNSKWFNDTIADEHISKKQKRTDTTGASEYNIQEYNKRLGEACASLLESGGTDQDAHHKDRELRLPSSRNVRADSHQFTHEVDLGRLVKQIASIATSKMAEAKKKKKTNVPVGIQPNNSTRCGKKCTRWYTTSQLDTMWNESGQGTPDSPSATFSRQEHGTMFPELFVDPNSAPLPQAYGHLKQAHQKQRDTSSDV